MALALLDLLDLDESDVRFRIDTGTNRWYQLRLGQSKRQRSGFDWIDDVVHQTPVQANEAGGRLLDSAAEVSVPLPEFERGRGYAQLFSFKTREGRSPAFSDVVAINRAMMVRDVDYAYPESLTVAASADGHAAAFERPRSVPCRTYSEQFIAPGIGELLTEVVRVAAPVVLRMLTQPAAPAGAGAGAGTAPAAAGAAAPAGPQPDLLAGLLRTVLSAVTGAAGGSAVSTPQSLPNRFHNGGGPARLSRPFVFGIDDALLAGLAAQALPGLIQAVPQLVAAVPQLMNAVNQGRMQRIQAHNQLVSGVISDLQRRTLLEQVMRAQAEGAGAQAPDLARLAELLQQAAPPPAPAPDAAAPPAPAPAPAPVPAPAPPPVAPQSLSAPATRAVAEFVTAPPVRVGGRDYVVFQKGRQTRLAVRLTVGDPVPKKPLPKAIVRVMVKRVSDGTVLGEKRVKQRDLVPNATVPVEFTAAELAGVPAGEPVSLLAEIRWLGTDARERSAAGATEAVFVTRYFLKERGAATGEERELSDMDRYRPFWNKVWESPALDAAAGEDRKLLWELDATLKYSVLLAGDQPSNGLMETRMLVGEDDADSVKALAAGRMKGGIELSVEELAKLASLWEGPPALDPERLEALRNAEFAKSVGGEIVQRLKLEGRAAERGLVWVVPVIQPVEITLGTAETVDDAGQVTGVGEERVRFPAPVAVRVIGLKSTDSESEAEAEDEGTLEAQYRFAGFKVELSQKVALTPEGPSDG